MFWGTKITRELGILLTAHATSSFKSKSPVFRAFAFEIVSPEKNLLRPPIW